MVVVPLDKSLPKQELIDSVIRSEADAVIFDKKYGCLHINPGACGRFGFHQVRTALRFVIDNGEIRDMEIIELGNRK